MFIYYCRLVTCLVKAYTLPTWSVKVPTTALPRGTTHMVCCYFVKLHLEICKSFLTLLVKSCLSCCFTVFKSFSVISIVLILLQA